MDEANLDPKAFREAARQTAHDIRSPLSALNLILGSLRGQIPEAERSVMCSAVERITEIANDLLRGSLKPAKCTPLVPLIESMVREKRVHYQDTQFLTNLANSSELVADIGALDFSRVLSNLIDNSVEAISNRFGRIVIAARATQFGIAIVVKDNGSGIPPHILRRLGERKVTHGKIGGSGLGLAHALETVRRAGGRLRIKSVFGRGTSVIIELPIRRM